MFETSSPSANYPGYRLQCVEVLNWGTFHHKVWQIDCTGETSLLTGDIGSGKSTIVDALTTLLVPSQKIVFNKAAGAQTKERNLRSYILGYHKSTRDQDNIAAKAVALRDESDYTVILARFANAALGKTVSLAQVLWLKPQKNTPERFYVTANTVLSICQHFSNFGTQISLLKRSLRKIEGVSISESYEQYGQKFRRLLEIPSAGVIDLLYQCVSMKAVGSLTEFVRNHMLDDTAVPDKVEALCQNFLDLQEAHQAIINARHQIEMLAPIMQDWQKYGDEEVLRQQLTGSRDSLEAYFATIRSHKLEGLIKEKREELDKLTAKYHRNQDNLQAAEHRESRLRQDIFENGGRRLEELRDTIRLCEGQLQSRKDKASAYVPMADLLGLPHPSSSESFIENTHRCAQKHDEFLHSKEEHDQKRIDLQIELREFDERKQNLLKEIKSLKARTTNIPTKNLEIREQLATALDASLEELPFIGELIQVRENEGEWRGAIERLLHNFGLSLLVPERYYRQACHYVDKTHLHGRVVYYRVKTQHSKRRKESLHDGSLLRKIDVKQNSEFRDHLLFELRERFDFCCCDTVDDFRRQSYAITKQGQIKTGGNRHEKDDRTRIDDRSRYVLGWNNKEKIRALEADVSVLEKTQKKLQQTLNDCRQVLRETEKGIQAVTFLSSFKEFDEIDWQEISKRIKELEEERRRLEISSDILRQLNNQHKEILEQIKSLKDNNDQIIAANAKLEEQLTNHTADLKKSKDIVSQWPQEKRQLFLPIIDDYCAKILGEKPMHLSHLDARCRQLREWLQSQIDNQRSRLNRLQERMIKQMQKFNGEYPAAAKEMDAAMESVPDYLRILNELEEEGLPRHEKRFRKLLREGTIKDIALFHAQLVTAQEQIHQKIVTINESLAGIEYNPGTYIRIVCEKNPDQEIQKFKADLKACLGGALELGTPDAYNEEKFLQVKALVERFRGRAGLADLDKRWRQKVTDVSNWFCFSASERWMEDDREKEYYSDSSGKSGGQKEKLAYTVLAAALAFQLGTTTSEHSFRFVMIDEAFAKGSDKSARYGLELFAAMGLQLMIATPLQKIHVIEDYIKYIHLVSNPSGMESTLLRLTIEEYHKLQEQRSRYLDYATTEIANNVKIEFN